MYRASPDPELLVVVPYHNRQDTIQRTANSILSQTCENFMLLIIDDASDVPAREAVDPDPRIKFFVTEQNVGRYFIDAVASRANPYRYYMPHDSDDVSVPQRLELLKERMHSDDLDAVFNLEHRVNLDGTEMIMPSESFHAPVSRKMLHRAHHSALYRTDALLRTGGYHPGFRVSYDTFVINMLKIAAKTGMVEEPLYVRHKTADSLTVSPETGIGTPYRARVRKRLASLYMRCLDSPDQTKSIIEGSIAKKTKAQMNSEIIRLKREMSWA